MDNYDQESEHSVTVEVPATEVDASLPLKKGMPILPLDTSFQASAAEMEVSMESNPIGALLKAVAHSSCSSSPIADLPELQSDAHLAVNSMFTARRSSDLKIQCAIWDFEASLHQSEAEAATTNEKAKVTHLRRDPKSQSEVCQGCDEGQIPIWYGHSRGQGREVHWARGIRSCLFQSPQWKCSPPSLSSVHHTLPRTCGTLAGIGSTVLQRWENKSCQDFLLAHQAVLHQAPQSLKEDLHSSYSLLMGPSSSSHRSIMPTQAPQVEGQPISTISLKLEPKWSPPPKRWHSSTDAQGDTSMDEDFPVTLQEESWNSKKGKTAKLTHLHEVQPHGCF